MGTFGMVRNKGSRAHQGWDLDAVERTPCHAIADGTIIDVGSRPEVGSFVVLQVSRSGKVNTTDKDSCSHSTLISARRGSGRVKTCAPAT